MFRIPLNSVRDALSFQRDTLHFFEAAKAKQGDVARFRVGPHQFCLLSNPVDLESVLLQQHTLFGKPELMKQAGNSVFGNALTALDDQQWQERRKLYGALFTNAQVTDHIARLKVPVENCISQYLIDNNIGLEQRLCEIAIEILAKTIIGKDSVRHQRPLAKEIDETFRLFSQRLKLGIPIPDWAPVPLARKMNRSMKMIRNYVAEMVAHAKANPDPDSVLSLIRRKNEASGNRLSDEALLDDIMVMVVVGAHQIALALSWVFYLLSNHHQVQEKVRVEAHQAEALQRWDGETLHYTKAVVSETIRLFPPFHMIGRQARSSVILPSTKVTKNETLIMSAWLIHRDARFYDKPSSFMPERWLEPRSAQSRRFTYIPLWGRCENLPSAVVFRSIFTVFLFNICERK